MLGNKDQNIFDPVTMAKPIDLSTDRARSFRKSMTDAERKLWYLLRGRRLADYNLFASFRLAPTLRISVAGTNI